MNKEQTNKQIPGQLIARQEKQNAFVRSFVRLFVLYLCTINTKVHRNNNCTMGHTESAHCNLIVTQG